MLIAGDLSGIQDYLFDVAHEGGAQSRKLRARSFFMQMLAEIAALRMLRAAGWQPEQVVFCNAGKFILKGEALTEEQRTNVEKEHKEFNRHLLTEIGAQLHFSLTINEEKSTAREQYDEAMKLLEREKRRAWSNLALTENGWLASSLILAPLNTPCDLCKRRDAVDKETDEEGNEWRVCSNCRQDREIGKLLPQVRYAVVTEKAPSGDASQNNVFVIGGWPVALIEELSPTTEGFVFDLDYATRNNGAKQTALPVKILPRRLARHIPTKDGRPIEFIDMAEQAQGDQMLGVLKMDGDWLGRHIKKLLQDATDLKRLSDFSKELDDFFAVNLSRKLAESYRDSIYTVFAGGDDLLLVGTWNKLFDFAGEIYHRFNNQFGARHLTISGGLAFFKPKRPIRFAAARADELLSDAKSTTLPHEDEPKNQLAAFGQIWKWKHHQRITETAKQLVAWTEAGKFQRGWLHTLLRLSLQRHESKSRTEKQLAASRLAYHVARNYPRIRDADSTETQIRLWANRLIEDFDLMARPETFYLPAITRYAMTATRSKAKEE